MFSLDDEGKGISFAAFKGKIKGKTVTEILYANPDSDEGVNSVNIKGVLLPIPNINGDRGVGYIAGPSGVGKSFYTKQYTKSYKRIYPDNPVYIFSRLDVDRELLKIGCIPVPIDDELVKLDVIRDIHDALCIFDDIDTIPDKKLREKVYALLVDILETGRHNNISVLITSHLIHGNDKKITRTYWNEAKMITLFPKGGNARAIRYALKDYVGLDNKQIDEILKLKSRWVTIHKHYPQFYFHEHGAEAL